MNALGSVAVLSDIHGVVPALEAVLAEPDVASADAIVLTGDIAAGPQPNEVLARLRGLGDRVVWVRGNADRELVAFARDGADADADPVAAWAATQLTSEHVALLERLEHPRTLLLAGFGAVVFCHGTPRDDDEVVLVDTRLERWAEAFADLPGDVRTVVCGHTHMPFVRLVDRRLVVNPGSVGMPYGRAGAHWALLRGGVATLRVTAFDVAAACADVNRASRYPDVREWTDHFLHARASDSDAIRAFGPRDGRPTGD